MSEAALSNKEALEFIRPMLKRNHNIDKRTGWMLLCSTPRGKNWFYDLWKVAQLPQNKDRWFFLHKDITQTVDHKGLPLVTEADVQQDIEDGYDENILKQEYYLDFEAICKGFIYSKQLKEAREQERITSVPIDPELPVYTYWDIGVNDATAIWFLQVGRDNGKDAPPLNLINYYENSNEGLDHYVDYLHSFAKKHNCKLGTCYTPHDMRNMEFIAGERRHVALINKGFDVHVIERTKSVEEAITQTKALFKRFVFDSERCSVGLRCLDNYRRKVSPDGITEGSPLHDWSSNGSDALRQIGQYYTDRYVDGELTQKQEFEYMVNDWEQSRNDELYTDDCQDYYDSLYD